MGESEGSIFGGQKTKKSPKEEGRERTRSRRKEKKNKTKPEQSKGMKGNALRSCGAFRVRMWSGLISISSECDISCMGFWWSSCEETIRGPDPSQEGMKQSYANSTASISSLALTLSQSVYVTFLYMCKHRRASGTLVRR